MFTLIFSRQAFRFASRPPARLSGSVFQACVYLVVVFFLFSLLLFPFLPFIRACVSVFGHNGGVNLPSFRLLNAGLALIARHLAYT